MLSLLLNITNMLSLSVFIPTKLFMGTIKTFYVLPFGYFNLFISVCQTNILPFSDETESKRNSNFQEMLSI